MKYRYEKLPTPCRATKNKINRQTKKPVEKLITRIQKSDIIIPKVSPINIKATKNWNTLEESSQIFVKKNEKK